MTSTFGEEGRTRLTDRLPCPDRRFGPWPRGLGMLGERWRVSEAREVLVLGPTALGDRWRVSEGFLGGFSEGFWGASPAAVGVATAATDTEGENSLETAPARVRVFALAAILVNTLLDAGEVAVRRVFEEFNVARVGVRARGRELL